MYTLEQINTNTIDTLEQISTNETKCKCILLKQIKLKYKLNVYFGTNKYKYYCILRK